MRIHDGAYGTLLQQHLHGDETVDDLCLRAPALVVDAHRAYLDAGARAIQTNSFLVHLRGSERRRRALLEAALACAEEAVALHEHVLVLATLGPAGEQPRDYWRALELVLEAGVRGVQVETITGRAVADAFLAAWQEVAAGVADVEVLLGCSISPSHGVDACRWVRDLASEAPDVVQLGLNCCEGTEGLRPVLETLCEQRGSAWVMPSAGLPPHRPAPAWTEAMAELVDELPVTGAGGCCGTTPAHVETLCSTLDVPPPAPEPGTSSRA